MITQVYKSVENRYVFQDKYFGRKVTIEDFPSVLASFLSNGAEVLTYQIPGILRQLYSLASIVNRLDRYRFYAASLLFIYDGDAEVQRAYRESLQPIGETQGISISTSLPRSNGHHTSRPHHSSHKKSKIPQGGLTIRLIDFAHCTTGDDYIILDEAAEQGLQPGDLTPDGRVIATFPPTHPNQPDLGFLLGLKSLCTALRIIWKEQGGGELHVEGERVWVELWGAEGGEEQGLGKGITPESVYDLVTA